MQRDNEKTPRQVFGEALTARALGMAQKGAGITPRLLPPLATGALGLMADSALPLSLLGFLLSNRGATNSVRRANQLNWRTGQDYGE